MCGVGVSGRHLLELHNNSLTLLAEEEVKYVFF